MVFRGTLKHWDVFGYCLLEHYRKKNAKNFLTIESSDNKFVNARIDPATYFATFDEWPDYEKRALRYVQGRTLDVGCGAGRHSLWLQDKGLEVIAIDLSASAIQVSRERGVRNCMLMSLTDIAFKSKTFDTVILMGNNFSLVGCIEQAKATLSSFYRIARPGANLIVTCESPPPAFPNVTMRVTVRIKYEEKVSDWFGLFLISPSELAELARFTSWEKVELLQGERNEYALVLTKALDS